MLSGPADKPARAASPPFEVLRRRQDFLAAAKGVRVHSECLTLQMLAREQEVETAARLGFTITKKVGNAVERNRIRRRLRAAMRELSSGLMLPNADYVLVARRPLLEIPFITLTTELAAAFRRVHKKAKQQRS